MKFLAIIGGLVVVGVCIYGLFGLAKDITIGKDKDK